jgi:molybdenum cofactor cytidylyltransferase
MREMIPGLILAAGASSRMGRPKALLPCGDSDLTFVGSLIRALSEGGVSDTVVVGRSDDDALRAEVESRGARFVDNPHPEEGQSSSLLVGLNLADRPGVHGVLVTLVDVPLVSGATVSALLHAFNASVAPVVRAVHQGRHGHPVIFSRKVFGELRRADPSIGAKAVVNAHAADVLNVEVDEQGVLTDIDTPEDYARAFGRQ